MFIRRLLWALILLLAVLFVAIEPTRAFAQSAQASWSSSVPLLSVSTVAQGETEVVTASFTSVAAASGATLDIEIKDVTGLKVAQGWQTGIAFSAGQTIAIAPLVWTVPATQAPGSYTVSLGVFDSSNATLYWVNSVATFTVTASAPVAILPHCLPKLQLPMAVSHGALPAGTSTRYTHFATWLCATPNGYIAQHYQVSLNESIDLAILSFLSGGLSAADAATLIAIGIDATPFTATENAFSDAQLAAVQPTIKVAFNDTATTRPVYGLNADGTLNPAPIAGELVSVADVCNAAVQIPGTQYFSVSGRPNVSGGVLPPGSYTICVITAFPFGVN